MTRPRDWLAAAAAAMLAASIVATPATAEIQVGWTRAVGTTLVAVATDRAGRTVVAGSRGTAPDEHLVVRMFAADGALRWSRIWRGPTAGGWTNGTGVDIGPRGRVFVTVNVWAPPDIGKPTGWVLRAYGRNGRRLWSRPSLADDSQGNCGAGVAAWQKGVVTSSYGAGEGGSAGGSVSAYSRNGSLRWVRRVGGPRGTADDVAVTPTGTVYVTGAFNDSQGPIGEGDHLYVTKLGRDGMKEWTHRFAGDEGSGTTIDVRRGAVVAAGVGTEGRRTWLLSLRGNGTERWIRTWRRRSIADLDIARSGRIWATGRKTHSGGHAALYVRIVRPDGTWTRTWRRDPADVAVWGTGVSWDPFGVSVVGQVGSSGRLWRLQG